jgi:hypothetical protein
MKNKLEKKYAPALDNYRQSCFVRSDLKKMKCVCKTQSVVMYLCVRGYEAMTESGHVFVC